MNSSDTRRQFLDYFREREHRVVPSSPLVLANDPTLLFANAGMNQFKDLFTGRETRDYRRAASSQKCLRVSGKHNDLEMVGRTPRHHTFFEMLGNFSFGDYFKEDSIAFAWEVITGLFGIPEDRLWVTVFGGTDSLQSDEEAATIWRERVGVRPDRILRLGEKDNFWRMGDTGPCGPCSEIFYDLGEDLRTAEGESTPETDEDRYIEVWNLVFMQFDQRPDGTLASLPAPSIDTGMGLERICAVLQGKRSNYDTDLFAPILSAAAARAGTRYGADPEKDFSLRVIADHARAFCFLVADGIVPANDKRGYVLRRLLRRAIRHGRKLGINEPFLHEITPVIAEQLGPIYPEIVGALDATIEVGRREELRFSETLSAGLQLLDTALETAKDGGDKGAVLGGKDLFRLYDTFGFPLDLARDIAEERGVRLDEAGFEAEMAKQRSRAQASWKAEHPDEAAAVYRDLSGECSTDFRGYEETSLDGSRVLALVRDGERVPLLRAGERGEAILEATPFYAEAGGQVGDRGVIVGPSGAATVSGTRRPVAGLIVHDIAVDHGELQTDDQVRAEIDGAHRDAVRRNHSATHLVHAALRDVLGTHVKQAGSLVAPDRLRFDFSHFSPVSNETLGELEALVNEKVLEDVPVETSSMPLEEALSSGAMALFGEKYGDKVRVVRMGDFSMELCGGTHCARSGEIGLIKLTQERGIASGTRRVEAVSGTGSLRRFREEHAIVSELEEQLAVPRDRLLEELTRRMELTKTLQRELEQHRLGAVRERLLDRVGDADTVAGVRVLVERVDELQASELRELADGLMGKLHSGVVVLGRAEEAKASILVAVSSDLTARIRAGDLVKRLAPEIGGRGGGRPDRAEAGGKEPARLDDALAAVPNAVTQLLENESGS